MPHFISVSEAKLILPNSDRIMVVGRSGGGKTTLSKKLSDAFGLTYQSLDQDVFWLPGWVLRDKQEQRARVSDLAKAERWVMDGSNPSSFDLRLPRADLMLWVRVSRYLALWGITKRVIRNYGSVRFGMAEGCPEKMPDKAFLSYIWNFERTHAPRFITELDKHAPDLPVVLLRSRKDIVQLLDAAK